MVKSYSTAILLFSVLCMTLAGREILRLGTGSPYKHCVCLCSKYKEMYGRILKCLNIVNLYRRMSKLKLKINAKVPQLLCIVVSVALTYSNSELKTHQIAQINSPFRATETTIHSN